MTELKSLRFTSHKELLAKLEVLNFNKIFEMAIKMTFSDTSMSELIKSTLELSDTYFLEVLVDEDNFVNSMAYIEIEEESLNYGYKIINVNELISGVKGAGKELLARITSEFQNDFYITLTAVCDEVEAHYKLCNFMTVSGSMIFVPGHNEKIKSGFDILIDRVNDEYRFTYLDLNDFDYRMLVELKEYSDSEEYDFAIDLSDSIFSSDDGLNIFNKYLPYIKAGMISKIKIFD